jgi:hypothetical protein
VWQRKLQKSNQALAKERHKRGKEGDLILNHREYRTTNNFKCYFLMEDCSIIILLL